MHRIDADGHVAHAFSNGDPGAGVKGTKIDAAWANAVQEELANAIEYAGGTLAKGTNDQLAEITPRAFARFTHNGDNTVTNHKNKNATAASAGSGSYVIVTLGKAMADTHYVVLFSASGSLGAYRVGATNNDASTIIFQLFDTSNASVSMSGKEITINVAIFGDVA